MKYLLILLTLLFAQSSIAKVESVVGLTIQPLHYWIEPRGQSYSVSDALTQADWIEVEGELNLAYEHQTLWFSQDIQAYQQGDWVFQITYQLLDYLDLYLFKDNELVKQIHTGDAIPMSKKRVQLPDFTMDVSTIGKSQFKIVGRVHTKGTLLVPIIWQTEKQYIERLALTQIIYGIFYGIMIVMALYHLFIFIVVKESSYLYYVISVCAFIFLQISFDGRGFSWFWPENPEINNYAFPLAYAIYQIVILYFLTVFLKLKTINAYIYNYFLLLIIFSIVCIPVTFFVPYSIIVPAVAMSGLVGLISSLICSLYLWYRGVSEAKYFTCAWTIFLMGIILLNLRGVGVGETSFIIQYGYLFGSVLQVLFLAFSLAEQIDTINQQKIDTERALIKSQRNYLQTLKTYQDFYEMSPTGYFQLDKNKQLITANKACANIFWFNDFEDMLAEFSVSNSQLKYNLDRLKFLEKDILEKEDVYKQEITILDSNNNERWLSINLRLNINNGIKIFDGTVQDITENKNSENLRKELDQERTYIMDKFSIGIGKEINTPLGSNTATTAFLQQSLNDIHKGQIDSSITTAEYEHFIKLAYQSLGLLTTNQSRMTKVIKRFSEVSALHMDLQASHFVLLELINEAIESQRWKMAGWRTNIICPDDIHIHNYGKAISTIIIQLIDNAVVHSLADKDQNPKIWLRVERNKQDQVTITFSDNGEGIKKELVKNLCQPFFSTKRGPDGHIGLGLYTIYNLVTRSLNGRILFPISGSGFTVQFKFPMNLTAPI